MLLVPLVVLAAEFGLRLAGYGFAPDFFIPHPAAGPGRLVENPCYAWRFMSPTLARPPEPVMFPARKPPGTCRVFIFGESAAEGDPAPPFGFARLLEVLLREHHPGTRFEVINTAFTAINSHVIRPIARQCAGLEGDVWVIYMGNNEVIGPFGLTPVLGRAQLPLPLIRAGVALRATRLGQAVTALADLVRPSEAAARGWGGMSMFREYEVPADDPRLGAVYTHFARNLQDIIRYGRDSGAALVLCTVASNLRDFAPLGAAHRADLDGKARAQWEQLYQAGTDAEAAGDLTRALEAFNRAAALDDQSADLHFRLGRCLLRAGRTNEARQHFVQARDLDTLRFRTDTRLNALIRDAARAAGPGGRLVDAEALFARASPDGIPGAEWFYEHVHFNFAGNYRLARAVAEAVSELLPEPLRARTEGAPDWLSEAECARRLGYSAVQERDIWEVMRRRFEEPIYRRQLDDAQRRAEVDRRLEALRGEAKPGARQRAAQRVREALAGAPDDPVLHALLARTLAAAGQMEAALSAWAEVLTRRPHDATARCERAELLLGLGRTAEAAAEYRRALEVNPDHARAHEGLGLLLANQGARAEAVRHLRRALRLDPTRTSAAEMLARLSARRVE